MRNDRKATRRSLSEKVAAKAANRQNGRNRSSYLLLPDGVDVFKPKKEGNYRFNIIPYIAGKKNRDTEPGELDYEFTFFVHRVGDGDDSRTIVCPKKTYGKPCPICEMVERLSKNYVENEDEIKALKARQRQLFNIVDVRDEENRIQIYETSYFKGFGEMLDKRLRNFDDEDDENYGDFADIPGGRTLKVLFAEETFNGNKFLAPSSIDFITRKEELPDSIIDEAVCLDSCLKVMEYDAILKLIAGTEDDNEEVQEETTRKVKPKAVVKEPVKDVDDEDDDDDEQEEEKPKKRLARKPAKPAVKDDDDDDEGDDEDEEEEEKPKTAKKPTRKPINNDDDDDEDEEDDDEDEQEKKPVKRNRTPSKPVDDEDDDDEEEEEEEEEKPKKTKEAKKPAKKGGKCPHGYAWGADCYVYSECDDCELCDECDAAQEDN